MNQFGPPGSNMAIEKNRKEIGVTSLVFFAFALFFYCIRSNDFYTVDGAFNCFETFHHRQVIFDINNHLLYHIDVFAWTRLVSWLGFAIETPLKYFYAVETMNCLAGAGCLAIFFHLLYLATSSQSLALAGTLGYGLSKAFIAQATNANQPMLGVFWSFLALFFAVVSLKRKSVWPLCVSGLLFAIAMATYASTIFLSVATVVVVFVNGSGNKPKLDFSRHLFARISAFFFSELMGLITIFAWAYSRMGVGGPSAMVRHFFWHQEAQVYLHMNFGKMLNLPIGMTRNIFPVLTSYNGIRGLIAELDFASLASLLLVGMFSGFLLLCIAWVWKMRAYLNPPETVGLLSAAVGFVFTLFPTTLYDPQYAKLWIQPIACLTAFISIALSVIARRSRPWFMFSMTISILLVGGLSANLGWVERAHLWKPFELEEAQRLSTTLHNGDLLVGGWDEVSVLYGSLYAEKDRYFSFPTEATIIGTESGSRLQKIISETKHSGGQVYFIGILDQPKESWDSYLGSRCGVPYETLSTYREHSPLRDSFKIRSGRVFLREFDPLSTN